MTTCGQWDGPKTCIQVWQHVQAVFWQYNDKLVTIIFDYELLFFYFIIIISYYFSAIFRPGSNHGDPKVVLTLGSSPSPSPQAISLANPWRRPRGVALDFVLNSLLVGLINQLGGPPFAA